MSNKAFILSSLIIGLTIFLSTYLFYLNAEKNREVEQIKLIQKKGEEAIHKREEEEKETLKIILVKECLKDIEDKASHLGELKLQSWSSVQIILNELHRQRDECYKQVGVFNK